MSLPKSAASPGPSPGRPAQAPGNSGAGEGAPPALLSADRSWPLTPLQQGMLFHLLSAATPGVDIAQLEVDLPEAVDAGRLRQAWDQVMARQEVLRTRFRWENLPEPRQEFVAGVALPWSEEDWSHLDEAEFGRRLEAFLADDRRQGFDPGCAPLFRLALFRRPGAGTRLVWTFHHALLDDRGYEWVIRDVLAAYDASGWGGQPAWPERGAFRDYLDWLGKQPTATAEGFWREKLRGFRRPTPLMMDATAGGEPSDPSQADEEVALEAGTSAALRELVASLGVGLDALVRAAWALILSRYSGEPEVVFGAIHSARRNSVSGAESVVGCLWNTVPVRLAVQDGASVAAWLRRVEEDWRDTAAHAHVPLPLVQGWSEVRAGHPLFETLVDVEEDHLPSTLVAQGGIWAGRRLRFRGQTNFPLVLAAYPGKQLHLKVEYDPRRFAAGTIRRLLAQARTVLEALPRGLEGTVGDLPLLPAGERDTLLHEWNATWVPFPPGAGLHRWFEQQAARTPEAVAVEAGDRRVSYAELNRRANRLARQLRGLGVGRDRLVGVFLERSVEMVVALLGVLKAGGAYVPIDPEYPAVRVAFLLADAAAPVVLTQGRLAERLAGVASGTRVIELGAGDDDLGPDPGNLPEPVDPESLAYVIHTSGSTGQPKGVMIPHRAIENHMRWMLDALPLGPGDCVLQKTPFSFDASVWEFFAPLLAGARLAMAPPGAHRDPAALVTALQAHAVTVLQVVPSVLDLLLEHGGLRGCRHLRRVCCGGEALTAGLVRRFQSAHPAELVNLYGPTEVTIDSVAWRVPPGFAGVSVPIGRPVANTRAYVLDEARRLCPVGSPGELCVGGVQVGLGYLRRPELTAAAFVPDPFAGDPGARMYCTGDRCRWRPDGVLEYLGRLDDQVKVRGLRVEPGEVEAMVRQIAGVAQAAVVVTRSPASEEARLRACLVPVSGHSLDRATLPAEAAARLPEAMVPQEWLLLDELPRLPGGKVDRARLAALPSPSDAAPVERTPPTGEVEVTLAGIWTDLLGVAGVRREDHFFQLGGHSLLAMRLVARVRQAWGVEVPLAELLAAPVLSAQGGVIARRLTQTAAKPLPAITRLARGSRPARTQPSGST